METVEEVARQFNKDELVTIALEGEAQSFSISIVLLCNVSKYFVGALEHGFREGEKGIITLPGADLTSVRLFIYWLCKHHIPDALEQVEHLARGSHQCRDFTTESQVKLVRLWCFADRFLIPRLQNVTMKLLLKLLRASYPRPEAVIVAFRFSPENSPVRAALVCGFLRSHNPGWPINAYGELMYKDTDKEAMGLTPGFFSEFLRQIGRSQCHAAPCSCAQECYCVQESQDCLFMVAE